MQPQIMTNIGFFFALEFRNCLIYCQTCFGDMWFDLPLYVCGLKISPNFYSNAYCAYHPNYAEKCIKLSVLMTKGQVSEKLHPID